MDSRQDEIERLLRKCDITELKGIATQVKVPDEDLENISKKNLLRKIQDCFDEITEEDQLELMLKSLPLPTRFERKLKEIFEELEDVEELKSEESVETLPVTGVKSAESTGDSPGSTNLAKADNASASVESAQSAPSSDLSNLVQASFPLFQREFKILGTIHDGTSATKSIKYVDLCGQVAIGRKKHKEEDIVFAIRRAVAAGTSLKTYIDSKEMNLSSIMSFLRSYMKERSPTELFNKLSQLSQDGEDASKFLLDALELRQMILVSSEAEGVIKYDPKLVQTIFLHTLSTGLKDDAIRNHMMPFLNLEDVADEVLIRELNRACTEEEERRAKKRKQKVQVNEIRSNEQDNMALVMKPVLDTLMMMQEEMKQMRKESSLNNNNGRSGFSYKKCQNCITENKQICKHCWKCCAEGHKSQDCTVQNPQGN